MDAYSKRIGSPLEPAPTPDRRRGRTDRFRLNSKQHRVVPAEAGTHTPCPLDQLRRMGPRFREDDIGRRVRAVGLSRYVHAVALAVALLLPATARAADTDPCDSLIPAAIGGPLLPKTSETAVFRWLANANYEIDYRGQVFLFDTYYNRKARNRPLGFSAEEVKRASVIFLGHGHFDHMSDIVPVAAQTQAPVVGAPITIETAVAMGMPAKQAITVTGGETLHFGDVTVDIALAHHSEPAAGIQEALGNLYKVELPPDAPQEAALSAAVRARGTFSPDVLDKGTLAFALTFPNGFKVLMLDSAGPITDGDRKLAEKIGPVDVAAIAYQAHAIAQRQVGETFPLVQLFRPKLYLPSHHDASFGSWIDLGIEPLLEKIRDELPDTRFVAPLYRSPICVATSGPQRGSVTKFRY
jgi:L-ascorbate metabolism protein UlaG (beta-lactamase superfamily)